MLDGILDHQDSHGGGGLITDGDTQWMTAGSGLLHIEAPPEDVVMKRRAVPRLPAVGQPARGPEVGRRATRTCAAGDVTLLTSPDGGALLRLIAGELGRPPGPGRPTHRSR
jgi:quercetin 2,3-dioxygenase